MIDVQRLACTVVSRVLAGASLDVTLAAESARHAAHFTAQQRGALQDLCFGTLRWFGRLDAMLSVLLARPLADTPVRDLLLVALYQLEHTRAAQHAVVDSAVRTAVAMGFERAKGLVNGVLRNYLRQPAAIRSAADRTDQGRYAHAKWWVEKIRAQYPDHWVDVLEQGNSRGPMTLRVNVRRISREAYLDKLIAAGMPAIPVSMGGLMLERPVPVDRVPGFAQGEASVQDAGAQLAAPRLDVRDGMRVLDACAAPGGKCAHVLELSDASVTALDADAARLGRVGDTLRRLGLDATLVKGDATTPDSWWDGKPYDRILADVPCSASGVVRRHPDIKWLRRPSDLGKFARTQSDMLDALWRLLTSGGKLLYATCSVFQEENHLQVARFLERHPDARREHIPEDGAPAPLPPGQILPDGQHDGFYYALLRKA